MIKSLFINYQTFYLRIYTRISVIVTKIYFALNGVQYSKFVSIGIPLLDIDPKGRCKFGSNLIMVNKDRYSMLGKSNRCKISVLVGGELIVGNKVGISNVTIIAASSIVIGNNILIGGGTTIVDTDFHSLNPSHWHTDRDSENMLTKPVVIHDNVFIGMNTIILKGVTIGSNVTIAAGSVVSKDIPDNQIWGGNPAKFIKNNEIES